MNAPVVLKNWHALFTVDLELERKKKNELKHSDRPLVVENLKAGPSPSLASELFTSLATSISSKPIKTMKQDEVNLDYSPGKDADYDRLTNGPNGSQLKAVDKVCPNRIYSMTFHPDSSKLLPFMGEKFGGIAIWDALGNHHSGVKPEDVEDEDHKSASSTNTAEVLSKRDIKPIKQEEDDDEEDAVPAIQVHPTDPHLIYTSSYDATIRELNFENQKSVEIASDNSGGIVHRDLRLPKHNARRWNISKKKIGCLRLCPNPGDRSALMGLEGIIGIGTDGTVEEVETGGCLGSYAHGLACSSAYFNPMGDEILSTSYDDLVRIWEIEPTKRDSWLSSPSPEIDLSPSFEARHDNQTGRWVSVINHVLS
ncbi:hypothetical protein PSHT_04209 [Puccinia striiformis]|uniref:DNA damage-binding protein CMR1 n=2 Tax=Puccinia striiformis TaxID=27350 RepID=A0A2S4WDP0_9BASI|nr:hypothetical protein PSHT_04209 [Puccinia striiformis]